MDIISSQKYLDNSILCEKIAEMEESKIKEITLPICKVFGGLFLLVDGHHRFEAAKQLGIEINFQIILHPEGLDGEDLLNQSWMDSDWYDIFTGKNYW